ncbi:amidase domain-containing protein [Sporosarcina sp. 6E9]|uniref:amidase domain-containing protein n=1 Tax=Sporosarcina sp. 6E9 TaxID=2819235 RepID=UPI001B3178A6
MYDRLAAVRYADKWWDGYNPAYPKFEVDDCTNYVSQCLRAGGAPMWGYPNRETGWWIGGGKWSLSWSTPHSLRWYLAGSKRGMTATQVGSAEELDLGDVIVYDFQNDGRYDHSTIVTAKNGLESLVNAHTYNVRHRTWDYKDSYAYRPNARYIFYKINDNFT